MRTCLVCKNPLIKRAHESEARFQKKKFCSAACSRVYMKKNKIGWWSASSKSYDGRHSRWDDINLLDPKID